MTIMPSQAAMQAAAGGALGEISRTVQLTKPIVTHGGPVNQISFREPTARDIVAIGEIGRMKATMDPDTNKATGGTFEKDPAKGMKYMVALSGYDEAVLNQMSAPDFWKCLNEVSSLVGNAMGLSI